MRVAITGSGGFIGKNLLLGLSPDYQITAFARGGGVPEFVENHSLSGVEVALGDFTDSDAMAALAAELGSGRINLWLGRDGFDYAFQIDYNQAWRRIVEALQEACAHRPEIEIGIEYKSFEPRKRLLVSTAAKVIALRRDVGARNLGALLDTGHALYAQESLAEVVAFLARSDALVHVHFNDNYRLSDDDLIVGTVNFLETMEMLYWLDRVGYTGWLSFDPHTSLEDPVRAVEEGCKFVRGLIGTMERIGKTEIEKAIATRQVTEMMALLNKELFRG